MTAWAAGSDSAGSDSAGTWEVGAAGQRVPLRLLLVDDQPLLRAGLRMVLDGMPGLEVVGEAGDGLAAVQLASSAQPDVVLMDIRMPGIDGVEATRRITAAGLSCKILVLTTFDLDEYVFAALRAGASGFLLKDVPPAQLIEAIHAIAAGDAVVAPRATRALISAFGERLPNPDARTAESITAALTEREGEVLLLLAKGLSNAEIADSLMLSETTVKTHVGRVLLKLGVRDRVQAVVLAYESGLVTPGN